MATQEKRLFCQVGDSHGMLLNPLRDCDSIECSVCGNSVPDEGFGVMTADAKPDPSYDGPNFYCYTCGGVFDRTTGLFVQQAEKQLDSDLFNTPITPA